MKVSKKGGDSLFQAALDILAVEVGARASLSTVVIEQGMIIIATSTMHTRSTTKKTSPETGRGVDTRNDSWCGLLIRYESTELA